MRNAVSACARRPFLGQRHSEIIFNVRILRVEFCRTAQRIKRFIVFSLAEFDAAKNRQVVSVVRTLRERLLDVLFRVVEFVLFQLNDGKIGQRQRVVFVVP